MSSRASLSPRSVFVTVNSKIGFGLALTACLLGLWQIERSLTSSAREECLDWGLDPETAEVGPELLLGVLGGLRTAVADLIWLRLAVVWEARKPEPPVTRTRGEFIRQGGWSIPWPVGDGESWRYAVRRRAGHAGRRCASRDRPGD